MSKLYYQRWYIQAGFERLFGTGADGAGGVAEGKGAEEAGGSGVEGLTEEEKEEAMLEAAASLIFGPAAGESFAKTRAAAGPDSDDEWDGDEDGRGSLLTELIEVRGGVRRERLGVRGAG